MKTKYEGRGETSAFKNQQEPTAPAVEWERKGLGEDKVCESGGQGLKL